MRKNSLLLCFLAVLFALPGIVALVVFRHPAWLGGEKNNRGVLLNPSFVIEALDATPRLWHLVYWSPGRCADDCVAGIDKLARVRLALGRRALQTDAWLLLGDAAEAPDTALEAQLHEAGVHWFRVGDAVMRPLGNQAENAQSVLVNPAGYAVLAYVPDAPPEALYKDLRHLLDVNREF